MANHYEVPSWAGKSPTGHHLDVSKDEKLIQKLMIDEKKCYLFGRNPQLNDFCIDHGSCSRVHAALVYHKNLNISYLVDLGSTHGTFIGNLRIEAHKPTQLHTNTTFHFGASTRYYTLRERPHAGTRSMNIMEDIPMNESAEGALLGLPESQTELDNLTEYNTAHNRRISMLGIAEDSIKNKATKGKRKRTMVTFNEEEIVINPEDIDPAIGRFRNLIQTTVVPTKKFKSDNNIIGIPMTTNIGTIGDHQHTKHYHPTAFMPHLYHDLPPTNDSSGRYPPNHDSDISMPGNSLAAKFGLMLPNPAPEVTLINDMVQPVRESGSTFHSGTNVQGPHKMDDQQMETSDEPRKKKYAKEAWPGRKPLLSGF